MLVYEQIPVAQYGRRMVGVGIAYALFRFSLADAVPAGWEEFLDTTATVILGYASLRCGMRKVGHR